VVTPLPDGFAATYHQRLRQAGAYHVAGTFKEAELTREVLAAFLISEGSLKAAKPG
jgi:hypothetical protein